MATTITTNEMIFRTLKTKVVNYKGERNPEPKYAEQLRDMGYEVTFAESPYGYDEDDRWMVNGHRICSCCGKDTHLPTAYGSVDGMSNIAKVDFENLFKVFEERRAKRRDMQKHEGIWDERYYSKDWNGRRRMTQYSGNKTVERYKMLRAQADDDCGWERRELKRAEKQLEEAMKNLEEAKARLARAEARNTEKHAAIDELLKEAGVR